MYKTNIQTAGINTLKAIVKEYDKRVEEINKLPKEKRPDKFIMHPEHEHQSLLIHIEPEHNVNIRVDTIFSEPINLPF